VRLGRGHLRVVLDAGQLELLDEVISQVEGLGGGLQSPRVHRESRHVEQPRHRTGREHQPVPGHRLGALFGIAIRQRAPGEVHTAHAAANGANAFERVGQRDRDEAGVDDPSGDVRQQRRVQHVIDRRSHPDIDGCVPSSEDPGQTAGAGESGEPAADRD
jgi:hypothetical protein